MSNPIQNVSQLNPLTSLSAFDIKDNKLHQIGGLHQAARQVADFFRNMSSEGQMQVAERNFKVSAQIHALIQNEVATKRGEGATGPALSVQELIQHNVNGLNALKNKINSSNLSSESREIINSIITNVGNSFQRARNERQALADFSVITSLDNFIFSKVNTTFDSNINDALKDNLTQGYVNNLNDINKLNAQFSKDIFRDGINSFMGNTLYKGGIDGAIEAKSYGLKHAINLRQDFEQRLNLGINSNKGINGEAPEQLRFYEEVLKDFLSTNDNTAIDKNYRAYAPFIRSVLDQRGVTGYIGGPEFAESIGLWKLGDLNTANLGLNLVKQRTVLSKADNAYQIEIKGVVNAQSFGDNKTEILGSDNFTFKMKIPMGQLLPQDENPPRVSNEPFIPDFSVDLRFQHSID